MAEDYYPEPDDQTPPMEPPMEGDPEDESESEDTGKTALLPKSMLGGSLKVGDTVTLKVSHIYEDEVAVEYETANGEGEKEMAGDEEFDNAEGE